MNKQKKVEPRKTLVRNAEKSIPKCSVVVGDSQMQSRDTREKNTSERTDEKYSKSDQKLDTPELYSTLKLSKKIDGIVKPRKTKSCSDSDKTKLAVDDKVFRKVNFPYDQPIYKDLIPLSCDHVQSQPMISTRVPLAQKDKEPVLSHFVEKKKVPEYYFLPSIKIESRQTIVGSNSNNLRLYKTLQKYAESD